MTLSRIGVQPKDIRPGRELLLARTVFLLALVFSSGACSAPDEGKRSPGPAVSTPEVKIGNYFVNAPYGISFIIDDETGFVIVPVWDRPRGSRYGDNDPSGVPPATISPDFSFFKAEFPVSDARVTFTWGRVGEGAVVARLAADRPVEMGLRFPMDTWPHFHAAYSATADGLTGYAIKPSGAFVPLAVRTNPPPAFVRAGITPDAELVFSLNPDAPTHFAAGIGELPPLDSVEPTLAEAERRHASTRVVAEGEWGDFAGAIMDTLNSLRLYASDNKRIVHTIGRGWWMGTNPDLSPYFVWDPSFSGVMASLEDPEGARDTVRTILSYQTPDGRIPSFSHWQAQGNEAYVTLYRSFPPVTAMCVWKMHERRPDRAFLEEVYPALVTWHDWWPEKRDGNRNGLLEWGSERPSFNSALLETGQDDSVQFEGAALVGTSMNADAVDLSSMWSMDAEYLGRIASALGKTEDARRFESEHQAMNLRINQRLWNDELGIYCSRLWEVPPVEEPPLELSVLFSDGLEEVYYSDLGQSRPTLTRRVTAINLDPSVLRQAQELLNERWSARWSGALSVPQSGRYRLRIDAGPNVQANLEGNRIEGWTYESRGARYVDVDLEVGRTYPFILRYFHLGRRRVVRVEAHRLSPGEEGSDWLTRLTPMNFYPLISGAPDQVRADRALSILFDPEKFWLPYIVPTVSKDDPVWPEQHYWRGQVWPPSNYLVWLGVKRYADGEHQAEFARRSVELFMRNWADNRQSGENYRSTDGTVGGMPHYSWGPLLCEIGIEALADTGADFRPVPRQDGAITENIVLRRIPFGGRLYRIEARKGIVTAEEETR